MAEKIRCAMCGETRYTLGAMEVHLANAHGIAPASTPGAPAPAPSTETPDLAKLIRNLRSAAYASGKGLNVSPDGAEAALLAAVKAMAEERDRLANRFRIAGSEVDRLTASLSALRAERDEVVGALRETVTWFWGDGEEDTLDLWERIAAEFHRDTGRLRPGKSYPLECQLSEEQMMEDRKLWNEWVEKKRRALEAKCRSVLSRPAPDKEETP